MNKIVLGLLGSALVAATADGQQPVTAARRGPLSIDVAGVKLGMPMAQAQAAATAASYTCSPFGHAKTFQQRVDDEVTRRRGKVPDMFVEGRGVMQVLCKGARGEELQINSAQTSSGVAVDSYQLLIDGHTVDLPAIRRQLAVKFGKPTVGDQVSGSWCDLRDTCRGITWAEGPIVTIDTSLNVIINADRGKRARQADEAAVAAAADREAPKQSRAAF